MQPSTKVGIDSPFGWPLAFTQTIVAFTESGVWPDSDDRRPLLFRTTDLVVREQTGTDPLSVSSNLLAISAMRCARLLSLLDCNFDRAGGGLVAEVYPAAAFRQWGFDPRGYKGPEPGKREKRRQLVQAFAAATAAWFDLGPAIQGRLESNDHYLDALVSAVVAHAVELKLTMPIPAHYLEAASAEGWIHLPERRPLSEFEPAI